MIYKVIKTLTRSGIKDITIVLGGQSVGDIVKILGDGRKFGANFNYIYQQKAGGIAEALYLTKEIVKGRKVAVILGDNIFEDTFETEIEAFENSNEFQCELFLKEVSDPERFGVAELQDGNTIKSIEEKPEKPKSNLAVTGLYLYDEQIFDVINYVIEEIGYSERGELEITDVNNYYVENFNTKAVHVDGFWSDAGKFHTLLRCSQFVQSQEDDKK
jgi:glucose-1-phosphate thymidylyltransferase